MPTRHAAEYNPLAYERHLSSPIYSDRRPIPANIVAEKAIGYRSPDDRSLLFFLQALSVKEGGLRAAAADLMERFPNVLDERVNASPPRLLKNSIGAAGRHICGVQHSTTPRCCKQPW